MPYLIDKHIHIIPTYINFFVLFFTFAHFWTMHNIRNFVHFFFIYSKNVYLDLNTNTDYKIIV